MRNKTYISRQSFRRSVIAAGRKGMGFLAERHVGIERRLAGLYLEWGTEKRVVSAVSPAFKFAAQGLQQNLVERGIPVLQNGFPINRGDCSCIVGFSNPQRAELTNLFNASSASSTLIVDQARPDQAAFLPRDGRRLYAGLKATF
ncbi:hypothetical protein [Chelativorans sp. AA-79]|uniref:hypothetical protein n=1 Tax=Chelativorans sp. AA-79 TaxID=3028735 RepID=UPI0023F77D34|nr:hypothetical protein [Chelativorans sp. AA-79]WEX12046.1 hypothetical protein PVE73_21095 [Chelativorans sp. AA-79]